MPRKVEVTYFVYDKAEVLAEAAAKLFADRAKAAIDLRGVARFAISGGTTPKRMFQLLADEAQPFRAEIDWSKLHLYWVDERCVGPEDADSNYRMTRVAAGGGRGAL
jgi:6-phosphogluconolactonase